LIHLTLTPWAVVRVRIEPHPHAEGAGLETMAIIETGAAHGNPRLPRVLTPVLPSGRRYRRRSG
jgi:hypothetical protein